VTSLRIGGSSKGKAAREEKVSAKSIIKSVTTHGERSKSGE